MTTSEAEPGDVHVLRVTGITHGAEAVGRLPDGRACFVAYAIPGELVRARVTEVHRRWARAHLLDVVEASPDRVDAPCPYFGPEPDPDEPRCGGCVLQHVRPEAQADLKRRIVAEQLERIGGFADPPVAPTVQPAAYGYRNQARFAVDPGGRLGFRRLRSNDVVPVARCLLLSPPVQAAREETGDRWEPGGEVSVRASLHGPAGAAAVESAGRDRPRLAWGDDPLVERVAGFDLRVSARSFFQPSTAGAEVLAALVREAAAVRPGDRALDLYAGVGLFARVLAADGAEVTAVESHPAACVDARANLEGTGATVVQRDAAAFVGRLAGERTGVEVVVLDPPRRGAGQAVCADLARLGARTVVYVSCDPAALARDARALTDAGLALVRAVPVDQFAQTAHIETVATFRPA